MAEQECKCSSEVANKIIKQAKEKESNPPGYNIVDAHWEHESFYPVARLYSVYMIRSTFTKKDGTESKPKNHHVNIFFTYCPFCGKKYPPIK